jgi:hypothetical protein
LPRAQPRLGRGRGPDIGFHPHRADAREGGREVGLPPVPGRGAGDPAVRRDELGHGNPDAVRLPGGDLVGQGYAVGEHRIPAPGGVRRNLAAPDELAAGQFHQARGQFGAARVDADDSAHARYTGETPKTARAVALP